MQRILSGAVMSKARTTAHCNRVRLWQVCAVLEGLLRSALDPNIDSQAGTIQVRHHAGMAPPACLAYSGPGCKLLEG